MSRFIVVGLFVLAAVLAIGVQATAAPHGQPVASPQACGCTKTAPFCCRNCDGSFAYCARSFAFCPECPAP